MPASLEDTTYLGRLAQSTGIGEFHITDDKGVLLWENTPSQASNIASTSCSQAEQSTTVSQGIKEVSAMVMEKMTSLEESAHSIDLLAVKARDLDRLVAEMQA